MRYSGLLLFFLGLSLTFSQQAYEIDLANGMDKEISKTIKSGVPIQITIKNKLLNADYSISVQKKFRILEQLSMSEQKYDTMNNNPTDFNKNQCLIKQKTQELRNAKTEGEIGSITNQMHSLLREYDQKREKDNLCAETDVANAVFAISQTRQDLTEQTLKKGEYLEVTISRKSTEDENKLVVWKSIYSTQKKGKWVTTYGFTFIPEIIKKSESFFSKQTDTIFTVTEFNRRSRLNFAPSIFFTWFPYKRVDNDFALTFTGGLGYDFEAPTVFLGGSLLYNQNIGISFGLAGHQQEFLNGRYNEGDVLTENLGDESLNEKLYSINPFISVTFRLGRSPFNGTNPVVSSE